MDTTGLRQLLEPLVIGVGHCNTHATIPEACERLGIPAPPAADAGSKRDRMAASFSALPDSDLPGFVPRLLAVAKPPSTTRNEVQDWLWSRESYPEVPKKARREISRALGIENLYMSAERFDTLLDNLWVLDDGLGLFFLEGGLRKNIERHVHQNPGDWSTEFLFEKLGAFEATDRRFALFLEGLASSDILTDEGAQRRFVGTVNECLRGYSTELRESGSDGGYPVFTLVSTRSPTNRPPKNIIFASAVKPDLRFRSAVDNDVEIVTNAEKVLVYDRPIGTGGLRWREIQAWWADKQQIADESEAKATLYRRLRDCLPESSPPQRFLFTTYFSSFGKAVPDLPALLPEVWLHWDPRTVKERGRDALFRFRMDFLMLLPDGVRVVLEVDGKQHYSGENGIADTKLYARMVEADRDLKLTGYEVFRFGGSELQGNTSAAQMVEKFFRDLFKRFRVTVPD